VEKLTSEVKWDSGRAFVGIIILGVGVIFLLSNWGIIPSMNRTWPLILIVVGLAFLFNAGRRHKAPSQQPPRDEGPGPKA